MKDDNLIDHYSFVEDVKCISSNFDELTAFFESNRPLKMSIRTNVLYYDYKADGLEEQVFEIDVEDSFVESDRFLYGKIITVEMIFPNVSSSSISTYYFESWKQNDEVNFCFTELTNEWVQIPSGPQICFGCQHKQCLLTVILWRFRCLLILIYWLDKSTDSISENLFNCLDSID